MSTDWGLHCKQCDLYSVDFNRGQTLLREVISTWPHIKAIIEIPTLQYVEVSLMTHYASSNDLFSFLQEHDGHSLELSSEYGDTEPIEETPPRNITCEVCKKPYVQDAPGWYGRIEVEPHRQDWAFCSEAHLKQWQGEREVTK